MKLLKHLPVMIQDDSVECGLTCIGMIASYHGDKSGIEHIRRLFPAASAGTSLSTLISAAAHLGMAARALRLELDGVRQLQTPCVLHWDLNHYVVLASADEKEVLIHDPSRGRVTLTYEQLSNHFTGVALEIEPGNQAKPRTGEGTSKSPMLPFRVAGLKRSLLLIGTFAVLLELCALVTPLFVQTITDHIVPNGDSGLLRTLGFGFLFVVIFQGVVNAMRGWAIAQLGNAFTFKWTTNLFRHLLSLPHAFFERRQLGDVATRFGSVGAIQATLTSRLVEGVLDGAMAIMTLMMMLMYSGSLATVTVLFFVTYASIRLITFRRIRDAEQELLAASAGQQTVFLEAVRGVQTIRLNNKADIHCSRFANKLVEFSNRGLLVQRTHVSFQAFALVVFEGHRVLILFLGASYVIGGQLTIGMLIAYLAYGSQFTTRASSLIDYAVELGMLKLHRARISDIQDATPELDVEPERPRQPTGFGFEMTGIQFRYGAGNDWLFDNLDLKVEQGEMIAITGPSGSGKSTLAKLMLGMVEPDAGIVSVGGAPIASIGKRTLREITAVVMQDEHVFVGTIADNIAFYDENMDINEVIRCAEAANVHLEIASLPMGYQALIGGMGSALSGGQRQRLMLARALYRNPKILILDEATSHLDVACERLVNSSISRLDMTRIVFAHRPETIALADRAYELVDGKLRALCRPGKDGTVGRASQGAATV